ncbi:15468_t:CDS:2 [Dentiscutata heterogama]|uniref:15468_t:CDS:1 n=1 Tax=Dentiscutata heterogama TaxID=1316150 RepID=A0ACA9JYD1_9GLOM|nr:15468_t:CDS:2 [Dentiscutata heterogama]
MQSDRNKVKVVFNSGHYVTIKFESDPTLSEAYDQIVKELGSNFNDPRYKFYFIHQDKEIGRIKFGPRNKLPFNKKVSEIISHNEIIMKRELSIILDDGRTTEIFTLDSELNDKLSKIREELIKNEIVKTENFKFLKDSQKSEDLEEVQLKSEDTIILEEIIKNSDVIRISLNEKIDLIASESSTQLFFNEELSVSCDDEEITYKSHALASSPNGIEKNEYFKRNFDSCKLNYGLVFAREGVKLGNCRSFNFIQSIEFSTLDDQNKFIAKISVYERINDFFFAKNQIDLTSEDNLPSEWHKLLNDEQYSITQCHPLFDNKQFPDNNGNIYFAIKNQKVELNLRKELIKPSKEFRNAVNKAIEGKDPYSKLMDVFATFGNFLAQRIILGIKLFKYVNKDHEYYERIKEDSIEWETFDDFKEKEKLIKLKNMLIYLDKNDGDYFLTPKNERIEHDKLNVWIEHCHKADVELQIISYGDLVAIYEIFEEPIRSKIKSILGIYEYKYSLSEKVYLEHLQLSDVKQKILMSGSEQVDESITYHRVKFKNQLKSYDYQLYGSITTIFGQPINEKIIKFKLANIFGFSVLIENIPDIVTTYTGKININWMLVGNPEDIKNSFEAENQKNIESLHRNFILVKVDSQEIDPNKENVKLRTFLPTLPINAVFAYTFEYSSSNNEPLLLASIKSIDEKELKDETTYKMHWCIYLTTIQNIAVGQFLSNECKELSKKIKLLQRRPSGKKPIKRRSKPRSVSNVQKFNYGICKHCGEPFTGIDWCNKCINENINKNGNKIYSALWMNGPLLSWNGTVKKWERENEYEVALKVVKDSSKNVEKFVNEISNNAKCNGQPYLIRFYGLSRDPETNDYIMILKYAKSGNLEEFLSKKPKLDLKEKLALLTRISEGLRDIHKERIFHNKLHSRNILIDGGRPYISDLYRDIQINVSLENSKGVILYIAPEILSENKYSQKADVYSFGFIMYRIISKVPTIDFKLDSKEFVSKVSSGENPKFTEISKVLKTDFKLDSKEFISKISSGERPKFTEDISPRFRDLITNCWESNPSKRPEAEKIYKQIKEWRERLE